MRNFPIWQRPALSGGQICPSPHCSTWWPRKEVPGHPGGNYCIAGSICSRPTTGTPCLQDAQTKRAITKRPRLAFQVTACASDCLECQHHKVSRHLQLPPAAKLHIVPAMLVPADPFSHIHLGLAGLLPVSNGNGHLLTVVDHCPRWPKTFPVASISAAACPATLFGGRVARFGVPTVITSDREGALVFFCHVDVPLLLAGVDHFQTTAYYLQSNGLIEYSSTLR
jgi:hypothetical protein